MLIRNDLAIVTLLWYWPGERYGLWWNVRADLKLRQLGLSVICAPYSRFLKEIQVVYIYSHHSACWTVQHCVGCSVLFISIIVHFIFHIASFLLIYLQIHWLSFVISNLLLSPSTEIFILDITLFSFSLSVWFPCLSCLSVLKFPICLFIINIFSYMSLNVVITAAL